MREGFPEPGQEDREQTDGRPDPEVPVPDDFPDDVIVTRPPGLTIEEQRRRAATDEDGRMRRHGEGTLSRPLGRYK